jgi:hypothetical protein
MVRSTNAGYRSIKRGLCGPVGRGNRSIDGIYTPAFSRARGVSKVYLFFLLLIGFKGLSSIYNTVLDNSYDNIL